MGKLKLAPAIDVRLEPLRERFVHHPCPHPHVQNREAAAASTASGLDFASHAKSVLQNSSCQSFSTDRWTPSSTMTIRMSTPPSCRMICDRSNATPQTGSENSGAGVSTHLRPASTMARAQSMHGKN